MADSSILGGFVLPSPDDKSVQILDNIIGNVASMITGDPSTPAGSGTHVFADMMMYFNHVLLGAGTVLFAIMVFVGTMNTSNEGSLFGRQWHSMWTPMRLIFGLIFVVPLKSGLCMGQKIILYAILIGITMGTNVWSNVIKDVVKNSAIPPVPSYMRQQIQGRVDQMFYYKAISAMYKEIIPHGSFDIDKTWVSTTPREVPLADPSFAGDSGSSSKPRQQPLRFVQQTVIDEGNAICQNLFLGLNKECQSSVYKSVIQNTDGLYSDQPNSGVTYYIGIGPGISKDDLNKNFGNSLPKILNPESKDMFTDAGKYVQAEGAKADMSSAMQGKIGYYTYTDQVGHVSVNEPGGNPVQGGMKNADHKAAILASVIKVNTSGSGSGSSGKETKGGRAIHKNIDSLVQRSVIAGKSCDNGGCSFRTTINAYIDYLHKHLKVDNPDVTCKDGACTYHPSKPFKFSAMYDNDDSGKGSGDQGSILLTNSWWWAGESYLVVDNALSLALKEFDKEIQEDINPPGGDASSGLNIEAAYLVRNQISVWEKGPLSSIHEHGQQGTCQSIFVHDVYNKVKNVNMPDGVFSNNSKLDPHTNLYKLLHSSGASSARNLFDLQSKAIPNIDQSKDRQDWPFVSCLADEGRGSKVFTFTYWASNQGELAPQQYPALDNSGRTFTWNDLIQYFNPGQNGHKAPTGQNYCSTKMCQTAYSDLSQLPSQYMLSTAIFIETLLRENPGEAAGGSQSTVFERAAPYLVRAINVLRVNQALPANPDAQLPIHSALDKMFTGLLGDDATNITKSANGALQELYDLGDPQKYDDHNFSLAAKQYSMIQRAQLVGISLMQTAINSVTQVYSHFATQLKGLNQYLRTAIGAGAAATAVAGAAAYIPFVGSALSGLSSMAVTATQIVMQLHVITVMTSIGMAMAWLPVVAFVMTSLFTAGLQFALLVPLMPYILFWAGQIAWLLGVLEAVVAAPIIMLGLATPGGHDFMGHTVPAIKMLLGVVFRPVLMVIGMITGILLTYIVITFSSQGFHAVVTLLLQNIPQASTDVLGILSIISIITYGTFLVMAFTKCFSPIYVIPEKVMQWVGGQADRAGQEELQQMQSSVQQSGQKTAESGQQGVSSSVEAQKQKESQTSQTMQQGLQGGSQAESQISGGVRSAKEEGMRESGRKPDHM